MFDQEWSSVFCQFHIRTKRNILKSHTVLTLSSIFKIASLPWNCHLFESLFQIFLNLNNLDARFPKNNTSRKNGYGNEVLV